MKAKRMAEKLQAGLLEFFKKGNVPEDVQAKESHGLLRRFVGLAFEGEVRERLSSRYKGPVPDNYLVGLQREMSLWGETLALELGIPAIERYAFDRIVEHAVARHNIIVEPEVHKPNKKDVERDGFASYSEMQVYMKPHEPTLGETLGVNS